MTATTTLRPHPWQVSNIDRLVSAVREHRAALDTSDTGTGKTVMALLAAKRLGLTPLVVCPKPLADQWERTFAATDQPPTASTVGYEMLVRRAEPHGKWRRRGKFPIWEWTLPDPANTVLIYDEARRTTGLSSKVSRTLVAARRANIPTILLSATLANSPLHLKAPGFLLGLHDLESFWFWAQRHGCFEPVFGGLEFNGDPRHMTAIRTLLGVRTGGVRTTDLGDRFPSRTIDTINLPGGRAIDRAHAEFIRDAGTADLASPEMFMHATLASRQFAELKAVPDLATLARDSVAEGNSTLLFVNYVATATALGDTLGCPVVCGLTKQQERADAVAAFQSNSNKATTLVLTSAAGGEGLDLHDLHGRPRVTYIVPGFRADHIIQALGRTHRAGALSPSVNHLIFFKGSRLDQKQRRATERKLNNIETLNNSDFGLH